MQSQPVVMPPAPVMPPTGPAQVQVQIPPGLAPGQVFQVNANGQLISVTVPAGCPPGTVLSVAVPPPPAVSLQPQPVMPPAAPQSVVEVPIPAGLTMGSVFQVQVNGMTIPVTVPQGCPPGTRLNVAGLPSAEAIQAKDEREPGDMTVCKQRTRWSQGGVYDSGEPERIQGRPAAKYSAPRRGCRRRMDRDAWLLLRYEYSLRRERRRVLVS